MKNKAFTLAEVLIVIMIVGFIAVVMIKNINSKAYNEKSNIVKAYKAIELFDQALRQICEIEKTACPMGSFIYEAGKGSYQQGLLKSNGSAVAGASDALDILAEHIKFVQTGINFCDYSGACSSGENISGAKIAGDIYIGIQILNLADNTSNCPDFYMPESSTKITVQNDLKTSAKPKCWAKLYIDTNGKDGPNTEGNDIFIYGLDAVGVHH